MQIQFYNDKTEKWEKVSEEITIRVKIGKTIYGITSDHGNGINIESKENLSVVYESKTEVNICEENKK